MKADRLVILSFAISMVASLAWIVVYIIDAGQAWEGITLGLALGGLGFGILVWADRILDAPEESEERHALASSPASNDAFESMLKEDGGAITRRRMLAGALGGAGALFGAALVAPLFSLGPAPSGQLFRTKWYKGARVVGYDGQPIKPGDIVESGIETVFPEGHVDSGDSVAVIVRVPPEELDLPTEERRSWVQDGCIGYSKICTHAGCPVALYRAQSRQLVCPCHQSTFEVLTGGQPIFGPAGRPLPQLPLDVDEEGYLIALGDYPQVSGPSFWDIHHEQGDATS